MKVVCVNNEGFNHQLTIGKEYEVITKSWAGVMDSKRWYIKSDGGDYLYLTDLIEVGLVIPRQKIRDKKIDIILED